MKDDSISRQAAIDAILTWDKFGCDERCRLVPWREGLVPYVHLKDVVHAIANLPSVQGHRWIPVTERLPEVSERVLCQCRANNFEVLKLATDRSWIKDSTHIYMSGFVVAWMPLPEPYKAHMEGAEG